MSAVDTALFKSDLVFFHFEAENQQDLFQKLSDQLLARGYVKPSWLDAITTREKKYPTGLTCPTISVAIPHTEPEHLLRPYIAVIRPKEPLIFQGMAGMGGEVPAELIVNLGVMAHEQGQIAILQALMRIFVDEYAVKDIMRQTTQQGMVDALVKYCS